jgi:hypothetical protein
MVMSPARLGTKHDCAGEGQQIFTKKQKRLYIVGWQDFTGPGLIYDELEWICKEEGVA